MKAILDFYLYSSLHIALCALFLTWSTYLLTYLEVDWNYAVFVSSSTWLLYSLHRIIGIYKLSESRIENRFFVIRKFRKHLIVYASIAAFISVYTFISLSPRMKLWLVVPIGLSLLYVAPLFLGQKRLRDFHYIKIFLVASCWALLCGAFPLLEAHLSNYELLLFSMEKFFFIFAITLPFDLRDIEVDRDSGLKTLAHLAPQYLRYGILITFVLCGVIVVANPLYNTEQKIVLIITYLALELITRFSSRQKNDYFYSGVIDGTMILFFVVVWIFQIGI